MQLFIVSGVSGAGKSTVISILEDSGYFCVDNLPPELIPKFAELCQMGSGEPTMPTENRTKDTRLPAMLR